MKFIQWCNDNDGFLTAILSIIGLLLSVIAIVVSIRTARLPFRKRLMLNSYVLFSPDFVPEIGYNFSKVGLSACAVNVGNRVINLTYLGFAFRIDGKLNKIYPINRDFDSKASLNPSEMSEKQFLLDDFLRFYKENRTKKIYVYAKDTEGKEYIKKAGSFEKLLSE